MLTDAPPRTSYLTGFRESDRITTLDLREDACLSDIAKAIESGMKSDQIRNLRRACAEFLKFASEFYDVPDCGVRVLAARPLRVREQWTTELFGDYDPEAMLIRVWMRTAVRKDVTSYGTFLSTLCHEFCHHLDYKSSDSRIRGILAASTRERQCSTIMHAVRHKSTCSGYQYPTAAGASIGRRRIEVRHERRCAQTPGTCSPLLVASPSPASSFV